jgi:hypothetical protein
MTRMGKKRLGGTMPSARDEIFSEVVNDEVIVSSQVDGCDGEQRFVLHHVVKDVDASRTKSWENQTGKSIAEFSKHQVNYGATKYIKP